MPMPMQLPVQMTPMIPTKHEMPLQWAPSLDKLGLLARACVGTVPRTFHLNNPSVGCSSFPYANCVTRGTALSSRLRSSRPSPPQRHPVQYPVSVLPHSPGPLSWTPDTLASRSRRGPSSSGVDCTAGTFRYLSSLAFLPRP
jgi:hypothetical protein